MFRKLSVTLLLTLSLINFIDPVNPALQSGDYFLFSTLFDPVPEYIRTGSQESENSCRRKIPSLLILNTYSLLHHDFCVSFHQSYQDCRQLFKLSEPLCNIRPPPDLN